MLGWREKIYTPHYCHKKIVFTNSHDFFSPALCPYFMSNGTKLAVAPVARATPLFLPRPEIIYIKVVHYSAPPRTYLLRATLPFCPDWRHWFRHIM